MALAQLVGVIHDAVRPFGDFEIKYRLPSRLRLIVFVRVENGPAMLAGAIGRAPVVGPVAVNELSTVTTGFAFAQFVDGKVIKGNRYGMLDAVHMAAHMADPETGAIGEVLNRSPNAGETEARPTFYSLMVAHCVATARICSMRPRRRAGRRRPPSCKPWRTWRSTRG